MFAPGGDEVPPVPTCRPRDAALPEERSERQRTSDDEPEQKNSPGCRSQREPAQPPGLPKGWSDPPPIDLRALAFARSSHRPSCSRARRAMPVFGRRLGRPNPLPFDTVHRLPGVRSPSVPSAGEPASVSELDTRSAGYPAPLHPWPCPRFPGGCAAPTPSVGKPTSVAGVEARLSANRLRCPSTPFTLTR